MFGHDVSFLLLVLILVASFISHLLPIPAAIGVLESGQILTFALFGLPASVAISLAILMRAVDIIFVLIGFAYLSFRGAELTKELLENGIETNGN